MKKKFILIVLAYFRFFAKLQLLKIKPLIIGVTGSSGKTSAQDAIYAVLKEKKKVKISKKANSETGIPLNILGLEPTDFSVFDWLRLTILSPIMLLTNWEKYQIYVVEMGIDSPLPPKNMGYLLTILKPHIGVILNATPMHSEPFDFLVDTQDENKRYQEIVELIASEKGRIVTELSASDFAVINSDQNEIAALGEKTKATKYFFGQSVKSENNAIKFADYKISHSGTIFRFLHQGESAEIIFKRLLLPEHFGMTFAAALCVGLIQDIPIESGCKLLEKNFQLPPGRATLIDGVNDSQIIDSSYNSSIGPALDMLDMLDKLNAKRKIAVLGDIREVGEVTRLQHQQVAQKATKVVDEAILVGPNMKKFALPVFESSKTKAKWFKNTYSAAQYLLDDIQEGDLILVKGSQNTLLLEIIVEAIMKNPSDVEKLLARRGKFWDKKRSDLKNLI